jgi:uncharacterized membrane protein YfcA
MTALRALLLAALAGSGVLFSAYAVLVERRRIAGAREPMSPRPAQLGIGFVTNFFDTLGIGSFAPTTSLFRIFRMVPDHLIPGTLMIGHMIPIIVQAWIFIKLIQVDTLTLVLLIGASVLGAFLGSGVVSRLPRRGIQIGMGAALLVAALVMLAGLLKLVPAGGELVALSGMRLGVGLLGNFVLGALMTIGVGAYAPSLILFSLLGMNTKMIFPIMMGSCALLMPAGGIKFVQQGAYSPRAALALTLGGVPGVLLAAFVVRELPLGVLRWLVLAVVVYTALAMLRAGLNREGGAVRPDKPEKGHP